DLFCVFGDTNFNISNGERMETKQFTGGATDCESVDIMGFTGRQGKVPRRIIHFASGETMEEYSTDEEDEPVKKDVTPVDPAKLTWGPFIWFQMWRMATSTVSVCDYLGERLASLFGINAPKYQYAIDEYYRIKKEEEEEEEDNRLAEEAERQFNLQQRSGQNNPALVEQPETSTASFVNISFELQPEPPLSGPDSDRVPSPLPS
uniref:Family with sequence similarity 177 member A1 n=1 Tax=Oryzias latipes TaxID=8090 RepID=A0A3P9MEP3_ORYLA